MPAGELRIYIGAAAGAGTTYAMLDEALRRRARGTDVVVGCVVTHERPATVAKLAELLDQSSAPVSGVLDTADLMTRRPAVVCVDNLAYDNPAGSANPHRWQDVEQLLSVGIDVITTMTVQHIESLAEAVDRIVGVAARPQVPDSFLRTVDQIQLVDITPEAIRRRIAHGNVFGPDDVDLVRLELFNSAAFGALRSLMMSWLADLLAERADNVDSSAVATREHVVVAVTGAPGSDAVIRRAARLAARSGAELVGVHIQSTAASAGPDPMAAQRSLLGDLGGTLHEVQGDDVAASLLAFAEAQGATQLVLGTSGGSRLGELGRASVVDQVLRRTPPVDVHVISHQRPGGSGRLPSWQLAPPVLSRRRRLVAFAGGAVGLAALTLLLVLTRDTVSVSTGLALYLLAVVAVTAVGGRFPGVSAAIAAPLLANWFLIEPYHTLRVSNGEDAVELAVFVSVAIVVSAFVSVAVQRTNDAERARREAATLAALAGSGGADALQAITDLLCSTFQVEGVTVLHTTGDHPEVAAASGVDPPRSLAEADFHAPIGPRAVVALRGRRLTADEHRVLQTFLQQLAKTLEQHQAAALAAEADAIGRADELRTAILRAVSHDLRSPLASIKASVSSLRQDDIEWPEPVRDEFLESIEHDTDRLTAIVTNLLDLSRLQAGVVRPVLRAVALEEVVPSALHSLGERADRVELLLPGGLADVAADPALLERVVANLVANAVEWSPPDAAVRVMAQQRDADVQLFVIDRGPGIHPRQRTLVLQPFHRLSDSEGHGGAGLGLAIADGMTAAMGGMLELRDTPRGGLTVVVTLPLDTPRPPASVATIAQEAADR